MKKIKKFKIKQNSNNEYSNYHYFIPKSEHIKFADARTLDTEIGDLRNQINELEEKTQYLIDKTPLIGFGTGESSLNLRGCANDKIRKVGIDGNSEQKQYDGYNLLDEKQLINATLDGVTVSYDNKKIKLSGTCTTDHYHVIVTYIPITLKKGTYIFSCFGNFDYKYFTLRDSSNNWIQNLIQYTITGNQSREITVNETATYRIAIHAVAGETYNNEINLMISDGTEEKSYEPYTGGQPSPNPDYPQDIEVIDNGWNLLGTNNTTTNSNGMTSIIDGSKIKVKGTPNQNWFNITGIIPVNLDIGKYVFSRVNVSTSTRLILIVTYQDNTTKSFYMSDGQTQNKIVEFTQKVIGIKINSDSNIVGTAIDFTDYVMLTKGTTPKPYLPYGHIGLRQSGKNLVKTTEINQNQTFNVNLKKGNYTLYIKYGNRDGARGMNVNANYIDGTTQRVWDNSKANWVEPPIGYAGVVISISKETKSINLNGYGIKDVSKIMLVDGEEVEKNKYVVVNENIYEPYREPKIIPINLQGNTLVKVKDTKDLLRIDKDGNVEIDKKTGKTTFNGTELWNTNFDVENRSIFYKEVNNKLRATGAISNHFIYNPTVGWQSLKDNEMSDETRNYIFIKANSFKTEDEWVNWLSINPTTLFYVLAEHETIQLPSLEEPITLWEGTNNFELITNLDTTMRMIYKKDIDALIADSGV